MLVKLDPRSGKPLSATPYPWGINALVPSPDALWVVARRRARVVRASLRTGKAGQNAQVGHSPSAYGVYGAGALWVATPKEDTVTEIVSATGDQVPSASAGSRGGSPTWMERSMSRTSTRATCT